MADTSDIPVIDQREAALRTGSGGDASRKPAGPAMVDMATPAPPGPVASPGAPPNAGGWHALTDEEENAGIGAQSRLAPREQDAVAPEPQPSLLDATSAALRQNNFASAAYDRWMNHPDSTAAPVEGYSPFSNKGAEIAGYLDHAAAFAGSTSPEQTQVIKERIDSERQDQHTIATYDHGLMLSMIAGASDPLFLTVMAIPGFGELGAVSKLGRIATAAAVNVGLGEAQQAALTSMQTDTNYTDNILPRIIGSAVLGGALGAITSARVPKDKFDALAAETEKSINAAPIVPTESTAGAAATHQTTLHDETFDTAGKALARLDAALPNWLASPTMRIMSSSPFVESRRLIQQLSDLGGGVLNKNLKGIPTSSNVEMVSKSIADSRMAQILRAHDDQYAAYAAEAGDNALSKHDFGAQIMVAWSNGDKHEIPQVAAVAKTIRPFFDEDHMMLTKIAPNADYDMLTRTAESYGPKVWSNDKITADRTAFEQMAYNHFKNNPKTVPVPEAEVKVQPKPLGEGNSQSFLEAFREQHPEDAPEGFTGKRVGKANVTLSQDAATGRVHVDMVRADTPGSALPAMRRIIKMADQHGVTLQADASPVGTGGLSKEDLIKLYEHAGFKLAPETPGGTATTMVREGLNDRAAALKAERAKPAQQTPEAEAARQEKLSKTEERIQKEHLATQPEETAKTAVGPPKPIFREHAEILSDVQDMIDNIQHAVRGTADIGTGVRNARSTKARTLDIPDNVARPWLSDDFESTIKSYMHTMVPHIETHRRFGSITLDAQIQEIIDAARVKMAAAGSDDAAKAKIVQQRESDIGLIKLANARNLGQAGPRNDGHTSFVRLAQLARGLSYINTLGGQTLSALTDHGRVSAYYGLNKTMTATAQFLDSNFQGMARADMNEYATALDVLLHTRQHSLGGVGETAQFSDRASKLMDKATANFTKITGIAHWDSSIRMLTGVLEQNRIGSLMRGEQLHPLDLARIRSHGIGADDDAAIREQWLKHGEQHPGMDRARTDLWDQTEEAQAAKAKVHEAIQRAASSNAFFIGKGDMPASADSQLGKFLFQFKGFVMGSVERLVLPLAQGLAHGDVKAYTGLAEMLGLGALVYYLKEKAAGRQPDLSPGNLALEAVQRSGVTAFLPDMVDPLNAITHLPRFSKFKDRGWEETLGGPTIGRADLLMHVLPRLTAGHMTASDLHKIRQLAPWQNVFYLNRGFNFLEGETADAFNLKGAPQRPALDYFNPSKDLEERPADKDKDHFLGIPSIPN